MTDFHIDFSYPWLLLLIIPAIAIILIPYFRLSKRYRRNRTRITSMVLHALVLILSTLVLSGMTFNYRTPNESNEIILVVDMSDSENQSAKDRDNFVNTLLSQAQTDGYALGVVTFGYDQEVAVPLGRYAETPYSIYENANLPDVTATNVADALTFAKDLFTNPQTGKIVLVTDGKETDGEAMSVVRSIAAGGIKIDIAEIPSSFDGDEIQIVGIALPDYHIDVDTDCRITVNLIGNYNEVGDLRLYDNDMTSAAEEQFVELTEGANTFAFTHKFEGEGLHKLKVEFKPNNKDLVADNNEYYSYCNIETFNNVLILESETDASKKIESVLSDGNKFKVTTVGIADNDNLPKTLDDLCMFDEIVLNNIAFSDLPSGYELLLYKYVNVCGGGIFTVGGNDGEGSPHAYSYNDILDSVYLRRLLPVEIVQKYTPPIAVMIIIDVSGSMSSSFEGADGTLLDYAKRAAANCLYGLTSRDYVGIMTLDTYQDIVLPLTPRSDEATILESLDGIAGDGGTVFSPAIDRAAIELINGPEVDRRHILIISDGRPSTNDMERYEKSIENYYKNNGITFSLVAIGVSDNSQVATDMKRATDLSDGYFYAVDGARAINNLSTQLIEWMQTNFRAREVYEYVEEEFNPVIENPLSNVLSGIESESVEGQKNKVMTVPLGGFYGSRVKDGADVILSALYSAPLYAQWKLGAGTVGSLMSDLSGDWAKDFLDDDNGKQLLINILRGIMPEKSIRPQAFTVKLSSDNYSNRLSVYADLAEGDRVDGYIVENEGEDNEMRISLSEPVSTDVNKREAGVYVTDPFNADSFYTRVNFVVKKGGTYKIVINKYKAGSSEPSDSVTLYKSFSYSKEYDAFTETFDGAHENLEAIAANGKGEMIADLEDPSSVFDTFDPTISHQFDPRWIYIIVAMVLFLAEIAVRKFKFKWPHEIIRSMREKSAQKKAKR